MPCETYFRNKRRSFVTLLAIGVGFAAISLFCGYVSNIYSGLRMSAIRGEGLGHLTIYKAGWLEQGKLDPERYMFSKAEIEKITKLGEGRARRHPRHAPDQVTGIVSNGTISTIFLAQGVVPEDDRTIKGDWGTFRPINGEGLNEKKAYGVEVAQDLAKYLNLGPGKDGVVMASTLSGQMNAMDMQVAGVYDSGSDATNDKYMRCHLRFRPVSLRYENGREDRGPPGRRQKTREDARRPSRQARPTRASPCEIKTWNELSLFYSKVRGMFDMMFLFIFCIVLVIVVMSTVNTMGMAVLERTREIGTLRALGLKRRGVSLLFALEGGMLGLLGSFMGVVLHRGRVGHHRSLAADVHAPRHLDPRAVDASTSCRGALVVLVVCLILLSLVGRHHPRKTCGRTEHGGCPRPRMR